jgi:hypothetical protein
MLELIIALLSGAAGGNIVGRLAKSIDLGTLGNSIAGILGGGIGSWLIGAMGGSGAIDAAADAAAGAGLDIGTIIQSVASGGVGGGVLMAIVGLIRQMMAK